LIIIQSWCIDGNQEEDKNIETIFQITENIPKKKAISTP